jgi:hypothetical protein
MVEAASDSGYQKGQLYTLELAHLQTPRGGGKNNFVQLQKSIDNVYPIGYLNS